MGLDKIGLWSSQDYDAISPNDNENVSEAEKADVTARRGILSLKGFSLIQVVVPWTLSAFLALLAAASYYRLGRMCPTAPDESPGWLTDFAPARAHIVTELVRFTGSPAFNEQGQIYVPHPDPIEYNGDGPDVDQAWDELTNGRYILITDEEAHEAWGDDYTKFWDEDRGGYVAGLDMFHTLHCVNRLRKLTPEALATIQSNHNHERHYHHCLSQIRQFIMCSGDMTPIPTKYYPGIERNYVDSDVQHTCRNFKYLREWLWGRYNGSTAVAPRTHP